MTMPLSLAKTENPCPAPIREIDFVFRVSTHVGVERHVSRTPWPSWPRRPLAKGHRELLTGPWRIAAYQEVRLRIGLLTRLFVTR